MKKLLAALASAFALLASPALATNCPTFSYILTNGSTADANQVMANFNTLLSCTNTLLAHSGANSDITSLSALSTPLSVGQGGTGSANIFGTANSWTAAQTHSAALNLATGTTSLAPLNFTAGTNLTSPVAGALEWDGTNLYVTQTSGPTRQQLTYKASRNFSYTGDVTGGPTAFDGTANVSTALTIANSAVTNAKLANMGAATVKGSVAGGVPADLTTTQLTGLIGTATTSTAGVVTLASTAQTLTGSNTSNPITPAGFSSSSSLASSGYYKFPGGFGIQWGQVSCISACTATGVAISFPYTFPTALGSLTVTKAGGGFDYFTAGTCSTTGCLQIVGQSGSPFTVYWQAVGY